MAKEASFDIVSEPDMQLIDNTLNIVRKEVSTRYDFRGSIAEISLDDDTMTIRAEDDYKIQAIGEMIRQKGLKQGVDLKFWDFSQAIETGASGNMKQMVPIKKGISKEQAKEINLMIKEMKLKVNSQIQGDAIRVSSKDKDLLQKVIQELKSAELEIALSFQNYR